MYIPAHFAVTDSDQIAAFVGQAGAADLVTFDGSRLTATRSPAPSAPLVPSSATASPAISSSPRASESLRPPQVPTRNSVPAPRSASSAITIAALGPPIPVLWMVSGSPSGARPVYPHKPRLWLNIFGAFSSD